jgi:HK97 family phage major capsid protein
MSIEVQIKALQEEWNKCMSDGEEIRLKYQGKEKDMPGDETERWERAVNDADAIQEKIDLLRKQASSGAWGKNVPNIAPEIEESVASKGADKDAQRKAWRSFIAKDESPEALVSKGLLATSGSGGGYLVTPVQVASEFIVALNNQVSIRNVATVQQLISAESLGVPTITTDISDADWSPEVSTLTADTSMAFGRRDLRPSQLTKLIKVSRRLAQLTPNIDQIVNDRMAYKFGVAEESAFFTGNGVNQPLGVMTAGVNGGITTGRNVTSGTANAINADDLVAVEALLKAQYRPRARWAFHRNTVGRLRKMKDSNNNYVWSPMGFTGQFLVGGSAPTVLGYPYMVTEYMADPTISSSITTGVYTAILGDFSYYWIAESMGLEVQVLNELYAGSSEIGLIGRRWVDGMPVLEDAFARLITG